MTAHILVTVLVTHRVRESERETDNKACVDCEVEQIMQRCKYGTSHVECGKSLLLLLLLSDCCCFCNLWFFVEIIDVASLLFKVTRQPGMLLFLMPTLVQVNWIISIFICHFPFGEATTTTTTNWIDCCQTRVSVSLCPGGEYTHLWLSFNVSTPSSLRGGYTTETGTETGEPWDARLLTPRQARLMQLKCVCLSQSRRYK